jgi:hypothetical protein
MKLRKDNDVEVQTVERLIQSKSDRMNRDAQDSDESRGSTSMALTEVIVEGTLKEDGTLELDEKPNLSPGRVLVVVQPLSKPAAARRGLVEVMDEIRNSQRARGYQGRILETMQAEEKARQEEDEEYDRRSEHLWGGPIVPAPNRDEG